MFNEIEIIDTFKKIIQLNTTNLPGNEKIVIDYIASILEKNNIDYRIIEVEKNRSNIIAEIGPTNDLPPVVLISHVDVVSTENQNWSYPPFDAKEVDELIYGRGTLDTKHLTVMELFAFLKLSQNQNLNRKVFFVATSDEEQGSKFGMPNVVDEYKDQFKNALVINEGGGFYVENDGDPYFLCTVGEKGRCSIKVEIVGEAGPASLPVDNISVYKFQMLLKRLADYKFPLIENSIYNKFNDVITGEINNPLLKDFQNYIGYEKFIISKYNIGSRINILPYKIEFEFDIQLIPSRNRQDVEKMLDDIFEGLDMVYSITQFKKGFASDCNNYFYKTLEELVTSYLENAKVIPVYALGQTDGRFLGELPCHVYGFSPVTKKIPFETVLKLVHQVDERIDKESIIVGTKIIYEWINKLGGENHGE